MEIRNYDENTQIEPIENDRVYIHRQSLKLLDEYIEIGSVYEFRRLKKESDEYFLKWLEYKKLEEQGLLLRLPFPLGTRKLYWACDYDFEIYTLDALKFTPCRSDVGEISYLIDDYEFCEDDFGKILFLTKEEAEQALEEMERKNG